MSEALCQRLELHARLHCRRLPALTRDLEMAIEELRD